MVEQGTIMDRIDFQVAEVKGNVKQGNLALEETLKNESSGRARSCQSCLLSSITVCLVIIILKFSA